MRNQEHTKRNIEDQISVLRHGNEISRNIKEKKKPLIYAFIDRPLLRFNKKQTKTKLKIEKCLKSDNYLMITHV